MNVYRRLVGMLGVGSQFWNQIDPKNELATVAGMLYLADVFELVIDCLDEYTLSEYYLV